VILITNEAPTQRFGLRGKSVTRIPWRNRSSWLGISFLCLGLPLDNFFDLPQQRVKGFFGFISKKTLKASQAAGRLSIFVDIIVNELFRNLGKEAAHRLKSANLRYQIHSMAMGRERIERRNCRFDVTSE